uniref:Uncharacterized protein n=1 Tax=Meloidogyne enterolobii TaxID=390850 RepID=A0A6V7V1D0_MELEN|nr:unnamed protein product [Meloidogyne enterolobii]
MFSSTLLETLNFQRDGQIQANVEFLMPNRFNFVHSLQQCIMC